MACEGAGGSWPSVPPAAAATGPPCHPPRRTPARSSSRAATDRCTSATAWTGATAATSTSDQGELTAALHWEHCQRTHNRTTAQPREACSTVAHRGAADPDYGQCCFAEDATDPDYDLAKFDLSADGRELLNCSRNASYDCAYSDHDPAPGDWGCDDPWPPPVETRAAGATTGSARHATSRRPTPVMHNHAVSMGAAGRRGRGGRERRCEGSSTGTSCLEAVDGCLGTVGTVELGADLPLQVVLSSDRRSRTTSAGCADSGRGEASPSQRAHVHGGPAEHSRSRRSARADPERTRLLVRFPGFHD